jgi:hypothetical protein
MTLSGTIEHGIFLRTRRSHVHYAMGSTQKKQMPSTSRQMISPKQCGNQLSIEDAKQPVKRFCWRQLSDPKDNLLTNFLPAH